MVKHRNDANAKVGSVGSGVKTTGRKSAAIDWSVNARPLNAMMELSNTSAGGASPAGWKGYYSKPPVQKAPAHDKFDMAIYLARSPEERLLGSRRRPPSIRTGVMPGTGVLDRATYEKAYALWQSGGEPPNLGGNLAGDTDAFQRKQFETFMTPIEGRRNDVYPDSRGKPTVGIGHLVLPQDHLKLGDKISDDRLEQLFTQDSSSALAAAKSQAVEAHITDPGFITNLASVNFQLGDGWTKTFPKTWKMIVDGRYDEAANALSGTLWEQQTPDRVKTFQRALRKLSVSRGH